MKITLSIFHLFQKCDAHGIWWPYQKAFFKDIDAFVTLYSTCDFEYEEELAKEEDFWLDKIGEEKKNKQ